MKTLGIDEAGRGPVIGPLVIAGVMTDSNPDFLKEVKDSKLLTHGKRLQLDKEIRANSDFKVIEVLPQEIDDALNSDTLNLNWLEAHKTAEIINELQPDRAIIDCPHPIPEKFKAYIRELLTNKDVELIVEHKADLNHKICAAGSILAKVRREEEMEKIREKYGDTGPGYPANPKTKQYVKENWNKHPEIFRKTWSTYKKYSEASQEKEKQKKLF